MEVASADLAAEDRNPPRAALPFRVIQGPRGVSLEYDIDQTIMGQFETREVYRERVDPRTMLKHTSVEQVSVPVNQVKRLPMRVQPGERVQAPILELLSMYRELEKSVAAVAKERDDALQEAAALRGQVTRLEKQLDEAKRRTAKKGE